MADAPAARGMVIVGGGECGARAAFALREKGWLGTITVIGRESLHAYERPPLSKKALIADEWHPVHPYTIPMFNDAAITFLGDTEVVELHPERCELVLTAGVHVGYEKLLIAAGAQPRRITFPSEPDLLYLRTHEDALRVKAELRPGRRIGILGAGFIGLELAASACTRGCEVTVVEALDRALARAVPAAVAAQVIRLHEKHGVTFRWGTSVSDITSHGGALQADLGTGESLEFDAVIVGIGAAPDIALAQRAGLDIDNGIALNSRLQTSADDIFAAGDCASFPHPRFDGTRIRLESWRNAHDQAVSAAANMLGADMAHTAVPWFWSDQYDHTLQVTGLSSLATSFVPRKRDDGVTLYFGLDDHQGLVCASAMGPGNSVARDIRIAEMMLERGINPPANQLADNGVALKRLLAAASVGTGTSV